MIPLLLPLFAAAAIAQAPPEQVRTGEFFPLDRAVPGTRGVARTVFQGEAIEEFPLEILGLYRNFAGPGHDIVLARLLGERAAFTGVVGGMSGSPVYVEGKLLGAIAYRLGVFAKEPIAGITPIGEMLRARERSAAPTEAFPALRADRSGGPGLHLIETPLLLGGFSRRSVEAYSERLRALGLEPIQAGVGGSGATNGGPLEPGSPIAAVLIHGDLSIAAAGTLTYRDRDRLYAFGHPFLQSGSVEIPAARASILWTASSWLGSNKIATVGELVGSFREDRLTAVVGDLGPPPPMIPVTVTIDPGGGPPRVRSFSIARAKSLVPLLVDITLFDSLVSSIDFSEESTIDLRASIELPGHEPILIEESVAGDASLPAAASCAALVARMVERIRSNPFREIEIDALRVDVKQVPQRRVAWVDRIVVEGEEIEPGSPLQIRLLMRSYKDERTIMRAQLDLPAGILPGQALLVAGEAREVDRAMALYASQRRLDHASDLVSYLERLREEPRGGSLLLRLMRPAKGATVAGHLLPDLPPSALGLLGSRRGGDRPLVLNGAILWEQTIELPGPVAGLQSLPLRIGRRSPDDAPGGRH